MLTVSSGSGIPLLRDSAMHRAYSRVIPILIAVLSVCLTAGFSGDEPDTLWRRRADWFVKFGGAQGDAGNAILGTADRGFSRPG
jgi:hypothetical protein